MSSINNKKNNEKKPKEKETFRIFGFEINRLFAYFVIYSFIGFVIETIYGVVRKGVIESRTSMLFLPLCTIYGLGAVVLIISLKYFNKNKFTLFCGGFLTGTVVEYIVNYCGDKLMHIRWWDYSSYPFNINGRVCLLFSIFWGILGIYLVRVLNVRVDRFIDYLKQKFNPMFRRNFLIILAIFMTADFMFTNVAQKMFFTRVSIEKNVDIVDTNDYLERYTEYYNNPSIKKFFDTYFSDERMLKTYPNINVLLKNGKQVKLSKFLPEIKPYLIKIYDKK